MLIDNKKRFNYLVELIKSDTIWEYSHLEDLNSFTRKRKMPLEDIVLSALAKKGLTTAIEIHEYFIKKGLGFMEISKQGYLQQRKKLNYEVFTYLNKEYLKGFYSSNEPILWNDYIVFAIDGSKAEVPNSDENRAAFGESRGPNDKGEVRALISCMYDVFNNFFLDLQIGSISTSETTLAKQNIINIKEMLPDIPFIIVFDRGYPSIEFVNFLEKNQIKYLFRLSSNDYIRERELMMGDDEPVRLIHTQPRLAKIKKNHPEILEDLKDKKYTATRIVSTNLSSGNVITIMTNLSFEINVEEIKNLYFMRWEIEKKYHTLKNKMKFESITGKATIYVYQDFWAQILVYNIIQDILHASNAEVKEKAINKEYKYPIRINENIAIGLFKDEFIKIFFEPDADLREKSLIKLHKSIENYILPKRALKSTSRKHNLSNKYKNNQKNSF